MNYKLMAYLCLEQIQVLARKSGETETADYINDHIQPYWSAIPLELRQAMTSPGTRSIGMDHMKKLFNMIHILNMDVYTDYPFKELDDVEGQEAPIRKCKILEIPHPSSKYVDIEVEGLKTDIKRGYLYVKPGRCGEVDNVDFMDGWHCMRVSETVDDIE